MIAPPIDFPRIEVRAAGLVVSPSPGMACRVKVSTAKLRDMRIDYAELPGSPFPATFSFREPNEGTADAVVLWGDPVTVSVSDLATVTISLENSDGPVVSQTFTWAGPLDLDRDGDAATDKDISRFYWLLSHDATDFDSDGDANTDADIAAFWRAMAGR